MPVAQAVMPPQLQQKGSFPPRRMRVFYALWAVAILALYILHFPHLLADFPNYSPWMDYSKYTDEGWYGSAAVRHFLIGHWFVRGDFNPAVALPVWPFLLGLVFRFTGVTLTAARALALAVFGANLLLSYGLVRTHAPRWAALLAVTVLVTNPFLFAFSRLAILEPLMICFLLLSWWLALRLPRASERGQIALTAAIGGVLCLAVLTKTTAIFIVPSTLYLIAHHRGFRGPKCLRDLSVTAAAGLIPWCAWYFLLVRPHFRFDYRYLFDANQWPQPTTPGGWISAFWYALHGALWISPALCLTALVLLVLPALSRPFHSDPDQLRLWSGSLSNPLVLASLITAAGYIFFTGWHNNPQPRYYETVAYPLAFVLALTAAGLLCHSRPLLLSLAAAGAVAVTAIVCLSGISRIVIYLRHPSWTWLNAADNLTRYIDSHPAPNRLLLSVSGADISLMTRLPSICDDYGTWDVPYRVHAYRPSWFAVWNEIDPGTLADLETQDSLERVAAFPAFDDPDRNLLILYRLHPLPPSRQNYPAAEEAAENAGK